MEALPWRFRWFSHARSNGTVVVVVVVVVVVFHGEIVLFSLSRFIQAGANESCEVNSPVAQNTTTCVPLRPLTCRVTRFVTQFVFDNVRRKAWRWQDATIVFLLKTQRFSDTIGIEIATNGIVGLRIWSAPKSISAKSICDKRHIFEIWIRADANALVFIDSGVIISNIGAAGVTDTIFGAADFVSDDALAEKSLIVVTIATGIVHINADQAFQVIFFLSHMLIVFVNDVAVVYRLEFYRRFTVVLQSLQSAGIFAGKSAGKLAGNWRRFSVGVRQFLLHFRRGDDFFLSEMSWRLMI